MNAQQYTSDQVCDFSVKQAFVAVAGSIDPKHRQQARAKSGRVVSGLLIAAAKRGEIEVNRSYGRVTGNSVWYTLTDEQLASFRAEAIKRACI